MSPTNPTIDFGDDEPAASCPYCDRPFTSVRGRDLHVGERHTDVWTEAEQTAYETATDEERDELYFYHIKVVIALGAIYSITVLAYMVALGSNLL